MTTETIIALVMFPIVGAIVSLDVTGLTLSKSLKFAKEKRSIFWWAITNACWHAGLLTVYILIFHGFFEFSLDFLDELKKILLHVASFFDFIKLDLKEYVVVLFDLINQHAKLMLGLIALFIVWQTYSKKIVGEPNLGNREELPTLAGTVFDMFEVVVRSMPIISTRRAKLRVFLQWQAQAALVAVDMLALAALMKTMDYLESLWLSAMLVLSVFSVVFLLAWLAGRYGRTLMVDVDVPTLFSISYMKSTKDWAIISLRLLEPLLIFYFVLELMGFLIFEQRINTVGFLIGAVILLWGLVKRHSLQLIIERCLSEDGEEDLSGEMEEERSFREIGANLLRLVILVLKIVGAGTLIVIGLIVLATLFYSTPTGIVSLDTEISRLFSLLTVFAIFLYYVFEGVERKIVEFFDYLMKSHHTFLFIFCAVLIAALIPVYDELTRSVHLGQLKLEKEGICQITNLGIGPNHVHSIQIVIWLIYMAIIGILFEAANRKRGAGKSLKDWPKGDRVTFVMMTLFASGAILMVIAIIQEEIRVAFEPCFSSEQAILVTNGVRILVG